MALLNFLCYEPDDSIVNRVTEFERLKVPSVTIPLEVVQPLGFVKFVVTEFAAETHPVPPVGIKNLIIVAVDVSAVEEKVSGVFDVPAYAVMVKYLPTQLSVPVAFTSERVNEVTVKVSLANPRFVNEVAGVTTIESSQAAVLTRPCPNSTRPPLIEIVPAKVVLIPIIATNTPATIMAAGLRELLLLERFGDGLSPNLRISIVSVSFLAKL